MGHLRQIAVSTLLFSAATFASGARADDAFSRLAGLFSKATKPTLADVGVNETWAGKCAVADAPNAPAGSIENFFFFPDSVLGDRTQAIEVVHRGDEGWPSGVSAQDLESERRRAAEASSFYGNVVDDVTGLAWRFVQRGPRSVQDLVYRLRQGAAAGAAPLWLVRVECNLDRCVPFDGAGPVLLRGQAVAYCYYNKKVLPAL